MTPAKKQPKPGKAKPKASPAPARAKKPPAPAKKTPKPSAAPKPAAKAEAPDPPARGGKGKKRPRPLSDRQLRFIQEYMVDMNGTAAYRRAGYQAQGKSAEVGACLLLRVPKVADEIARLRGETARKLEISREEALSEAWAIVKADPRDLMEYRRFACPACHPGGKDDDRRDPNPACESCHGDGRPNLIFKDSRKLSRQALALFAGIKVTKEGMEIKTHSKLDALDKVFRHLGMYDADKPPAANVSVAVGPVAGDLTSLPPAEAYMVMIQGRK